MGQMEKAGEYAFMAFVIIAIIAGIVVGALPDYRPPTNTDIDGWVTFILVILGIIVGFTTVTEKETQPFLIAAIALAVANAAEPFAALNMVLDPLGYIADYIVKYIAVFVIPAAVILAIKAVYALARTR